MIYIGHAFHRGRDGRCTYPIRKGDHFATCGKMVTLHLATESVENYREGYG